LVLSRNPDLSAPTYSAFGNTAAPAGNTLTLTVQGLTPDTTYYYGVEVAGVLRPEAKSRGRFHSFPLGRSSFKIAFASCSDFRSPDQRAFEAIAQEDPLIFIHMGDLHYIDTNSTNIEDYRANYDAVLNEPSESAFFRQIPIAYMWDDHDFCGNDSNASSLGRDTARSAYKERTPHYPIAAGAGGTMAQAFTIGRVRVIITDLRSGADQPSKKESASKTHMGTAQKNWFKQELISARDAGFPLILWVSSNPWIAALNPLQDSDNWSGYATERVELANFIRDNRLTNLVILSGDMHALAYDDGTNSDYATGGGAPITVLQAASLTQDGTIKGGPYAGGPVPGYAQYGILEIYDTGGPNIACRFLGMGVDEPKRKLSYIFGSSSPSSAADAFINVSMLGRITSGADSMISGVVVSGNGPQTVLARAVGPTLSAFGVTDAVSRPRLTIYQGDRVVGTNAGWGSVDGAAALSTLSAESGTTALVNAFDRAGAFRFTDSSSQDSAVLLKLAPGAYTVQVTSEDRQPGAALVEIYDLR
jgi:alkaline phosphatase D